MKQHVTKPTHIGGHILDVIITRDTDNIVSHVDIVDPGLSDSSGKVSRDHLAVTFTTKISKPAPVRKTVTFRKLSTINVQSFKSDIIH